MLEILDAYEVPCYLPLYRKVVKYRKGRAVHDLPLFPNYVFSRKLPLSLLHSKAALSTLVNQVAVSGDDSACLIEELRGVRSMLASKAPVEACDELVLGQAVKVKTGPMKDLEGIVVQKLGVTRLVINVHLLGRSVQVQIDPADLKKG